MNDPIRNERLTIFGPRYQVWNLILQTLDGNGFVKATQKEISIRYGVSERTIQDHFKELKSAGMLEKKRDSEGRMRFWATPEHYWNYKLFRRNDLLAKRNTHLTEEQVDRIEELGLSVLEGGKQ